MSYVFIYGIQPVIFHGPHSSIDYKYWHFIDINCLTFKEHTRSLSLQDGPSHLSLGAIVGSSAGAAVVVIAFLIVGVVVWRKRRAQSGTTCICFLTKKCHFIITDILTSWRVIWKFWPVTIIEFSIQSVLLSASKRHGIRYAQYYNYLFTVSII